MPRRWVFLAHGMEGLYDEWRSGTPRSITDEQVAEVVYKTLQTTPKDETHWTVHGMAKESGQSRDAVHRIWKTFGLKPHLSSRSARSRHELEMR
ncbi:MAG TPA: helix-turn-helix domain-containing protein [Candidatus Handelsmanbacteria bacterium]|nr:helix-turn-helix domain-containing protein [Candidatus Handelsmanbacteria bacterium]